MDTDKRRSEEAKQKRHNTIIEKYGSMEAYKEQMRIKGREGSLARVNPYYHFKDKKLAKEYGRLGGIAKATKNK